MASVILIWIITILFFIIFVVYFGYPIFLQFLPQTVLCTRHSTSNSCVYHIVPFYNEERVAEKKVLNSLKIQFSGTVKHVFVVDKSSDNTTKVLQGYASKHPDKIICIDKGYRQGKNDSLNKAIEHVNPEENDILFFSDANTMFNNDILSILCEELSKGYALVGGSMQYLDEATGSAKSEGLYWRYEEWIRKNEAKIGRCIVVNGGNFVMLAKHYERLPAFVPNDFEAPLRLCGKGMKVGFCPNAKGLESAVLDESEEMNRKKRMGNRQMNCIKYLWSNLDFKTKIHVFIRKIIRWSGFHLFLLGSILAILLSSLHLFNSYQLFGLIGLSGLVVVLVTELLFIMGFNGKLIDILHHAISVHRNSFKGMISSIFGKKVSTWNKAESNR